MARIFSRERSPGLPATVRPGQSARSLPSNSLVDQSPSTSVTSTTSNIVDAITNGDYSSVVNSNPQDLSQAIQYIVSYGDNISYDALENFISQYTNTTGDQTYLNQLQTLQQNWNSGLMQDPNFIGRNYVVDKMKYGSFNVLNFTLVANASAKLLLAPTAGVRRIGLIIANESAATSMRVNFGADAGTNVGVLVAASGSIFFDAVVPQDDVYLFSAGAIVVSLTYSNKADFGGI